MRMIFWSTIVGVVLVLLNSTPELALLQEATERIFEIVPPAIFFIPVVAFTFTKWMISKV